jgi:very-short-patch-repair endonuclease
LRPLPRRSRSPRRGDAGAGIELPERNQEVGPWTVDCLWRQQRVVVELDGGQHGRPHQADLDRERDLWLRRHGHVLRRYGKRQIEDQPHEVIADLVAARGYAAAGAPLRLL